MALEVKYLQQKIEENTCMCIIIILHCEIVQLLVESKKEIELLQEKITLLTGQLLTKEETNQKLIDTITGTRYTCNKTILPIWVMGRKVAQEVLNAKSNPNNSV